MRTFFIQTVFSALIGGAVGAAVVYFTAGKVTLDNLEVGNLKITKQAVLVDKDGKDDVILRDGSVLANQVVVGKKFVAQQYQGHVFIGNRIFTSPDNLNETPMEQWRFFTEIGSSSELGGEMIVRSPHGANIVGQPVKSGWLLRTGFDAKDGPMVLAVNNQQGAVARVPFVVPSPEQQKQQVNSAAPVSTPTPAVTPVPGTENNSAAAEPAKKPATVAEVPKTNETPKR